MMNKGNMLQVIETKLEKILGDIEGRIKICDYKPSAKDIEVKEFAIAVGKDILELINDMKSGFMDMKDTDKICIRCHRKYSMLSFGSTKNTCSECFEKQLRPSEIRT